MKQDTAGNAIDNTPPEYPFTAVVGQDKLKQALLWCAVEPSLGGLLICGSRGSAKSTLARGLAELLGKAPFVTLPLGASEEKVSGSLDLEAALAGQVKFSPGLLHRAHGGVLYVDEINLLPDRLVDVLLEAAASGVNFVERDGVSHRHAARFLLIGTMNPEEGELRPQLLDRFGLCYSSSEELGEAQRMEAVQRRLSFDDDAKAFRKCHASAQKKLAQRIAAAQQRLADTQVDEALRQQIATLCRNEGVEGLRADLALYRGARAAAALAGKTRVAAEQLAQVQEFALQHRRRSGKSPSPPPASNTPDSNRRQQRKSAAETDAMDKQGAPQQSAAEASAMGETGASQNTAEAGAMDTQGAAQSAAKNNASHQSNGEAQSTQAGDWGRLPPTAVQLGVEQLLLPEDSAKKS